MTKKIERCSQCEFRVDIELLSDGTPPRGHCNCKDMRAIDDSERIPDWCPMRGKTVTLLWPEKGGE